MSTRRKSVFAETYDPEDDEDKDEKVRSVRAIINPLVKFTAVEISTEAHFTDFMSILDCSSKIRQSTKKSSGGRKGDFVISFSRIWTIKWSFRRHVWKKSYAKRIHNQARRRRRQLLCCRKVGGKKMYYYIHYCCEIISMLIVTWPKQLLIFF